MRIKREKSPLKLSLYILGLGTFVILLLYLFFNKREAQASWFDEAWRYRVPIVVSNTGSTVIDQKIKFDIDTATLITANKLQSDCGDSRFTDANGVLLDYYIDASGGACNTSSTDYYVLAESLPAGGFTVYHYYGNSSADNGTVASQFSQSTFSPGSAPSEGSEEKNPAPVAYWSLDEGYGITVNSYPQNFHPGSISGAAWQSVDECAKGQCLYFDGSDDYVTVSDNSALDFTNALTMEAWVKPNSIDSAGTWDRVLSKGGVIDLAVTTNNSYGFVFRINDGTNHDVYSSVIPELNKWVHVAVTYDGANVRFYIDGRLRYTSSSYTYSATNSSNPFTIGNLYNGGAYDRPFHGSIDEPRIYNYARSASQIRADYNAGGNTSGSTGQVANAQQADSLNDGLVGYWKFDEASWDGTSGEVIDSSGTGDNGTAMCDNTYDTCAGGVPTTTIAKFNRSGEFNQDGQRVYINNTDLGSSDKFESESIWFKADTLPGSGSRMQIWSHIATYDSTGSNPTVATHNRNPLWLNSSGQVVFNALSYSGTYQCSNWTIGEYFNRTLTSTDSVTTSTWNHFAYTIDWGSRNEIILKIYLNGKLAGEYSEGDRSCSSNNQHTWLGKAKGTGSGYIDFDGNLDEYRRYKRLLSPNEIEALYEWGPDPVARWTLDEKTGTTVNDISSSGYSGSFSGAPTWSQGKLGNGLDFDGTDDAVDFSDIDNFEFTGNFSATAWINLDSHSTTPGILCKGAAASAGWCFRVDTSGYLQMATNSTTESSSTAMSTGQWYHVAVSVSESGVVSLYLNGILVNTPGALTFATNAFALVTIGASHNGSTYGNYANGRIDDVHVYNYPLTTKQIVNIMNGGSVNDRAVGSPIGHPILYWKFNEGYGTTAYDNSENSYDGTLNNMDSPATASSGWSDSGKFGKGLAFDGTDDFVNLADNDSLSANTTGQLTASAWVNFDTLASRQCVVCKGANTQYEWEIRTETDGTFRVYVYNLAGTVYMGGIINRTLSTGRWYYLSFTVDVNTPLLNVYLDGAKVESYTSSSGSYENGTAPFRVGRRGDSVYALDGYADEVKVYNYALSESEIVLDYNQGKSIVFGNASTTSAGAVADDSQARGYCVPGDTSTCGAPVAEWRLDEATGSTVYDTTGGANTGTITGAIWAQGKKGSALSFDGSSDYVRSPETTAMDITSSISVSAWIYSKADQPNNAGAVSKDGSGNFGNFCLCFDSTSSDVLRFGFHDGTSQKETDTVDGIPENQWVYVVGVFDDTNDEIHIYMNGILKSTLSGVTTNPVTNNNDVGIATRVGTGLTTHIFTGLIDEVRIYSYARTPAQIAWEYNQGAPSAWYKFDECQGSTIYDWAPNASGGFNGNNGTLSVGGSGTNTSVGTCAGSSGEAWADGATGKINSSLEFDGTDDIISVSDDDLLDQQSNDFTLTAWFKTSDASVQYIMAKQITSFTGQGYNLRLDTNGYVKGVISDGTDYIDNGSTNKDYRDGEWHNVVMTWSNSEQRQKIYIDGILLSNNTSSNIGDTSNSATFYIGRNGVSATQYFVGQLDDLRVYNYALTEAQVKVLYNGGASSFK